MNVIIGWHMACLDHFHRNLLEVLKTPRNSFSGGKCCCA